MTALQHYFKDHFYSLSIETYMELALFHPEYGFYIKSSPLNHDFSTPSLLSFAFNQSIAEWVKDQRLSCTIEYGAGQGETALEILKILPEQPYYFIEKSLYHQKIQQDRIKSLCAKWVNKITKPLNAVVILQEVFDCLPARWFKYKNNKLLEMLIETKNFTVIEQEVINTPDRLLNLINKKEKNEFQLMYADLSINLLKDIYDQLDCGVVFILDYGDRTNGLLASQSLVSTPIRAYKNHQQLISFWDQPGFSDLTYDVDFDLLMETWVALKGSILFYGPLNSFLIEKTIYLEKNVLEVTCFLTVDFLAKHLRF
jgi:SAM-dependent MidA family methyltransferase